MIRTDKINITINTNKVKNKYEKLGYIIPDKYINCVIEIDIKDLNKTSHKHVECECDICGGINRTTYLAYNKSINKHGYYSCSGKCSTFKIKNVKKEIYGDENYNNKEKNKETCLEKYGVENVFKRYDIKEKSKAIIFKKYGVENPSQSDEVKNKKFRTCFDNYGVESPFQSYEIREKIKNTNLEKYGCENPNQNKDVREKSKITSLEKYGVEYPMQNIFCFEKQYRSATILRYFENTKIYYQGTYEFDFLKNYYNIGIKKINSIKYHFENKDRIYFPDFYHEPLNLIIEIKSDYTFNIDLDKNLAKQKSCLDKGYNFIFIINKNYENFQKILYNI